MSSLVQSHSLPVEADCNSDLQEKSVCVSVRVNNRSNNRLGGGGRPTGLRLITPTWPVHLEKKLSFLHP